jgi:hypothetical protein
MSTLRIRNFLVICLNLEFKHSLEGYEVLCNCSIQRFRKFQFEIWSNFRISQVTPFCLEQKFQQHPSISEIITPEPLGALGCVNDRWKYKKVNNNVGIEGFLRLHFNWSQKMRILKMLNSVQKRIAVT